MGMPDIRHINTAKNNLWEIRVKFWEGYLRIFICLHPLRTNTYIVLNYFIKKDEKTPKSEIEKADRIMFLLKESVKLNEK
jgi:phage-related protein